MEEEKQKRKEREEDINTKMQPQKTNNKECITGIPSPEIDQSSLSLGDKP